MRTLAQWFAILMLVLCACSSDDNYVISGYAPVVISPIRSSLSAQMTFTDSNGKQHPQWVIVLTDASDVCTKLATHPDYFQHPIEVFSAAIVWVPPGNIGTYFVPQQDTSGSVAGNEVLVGGALPDGGNPQLTRLVQVNNAGGNIALSQFDVGGEAKGNFDVAVFDPTGAPREFLGKFQTNYCKAMETAQLP